MVKPLGSLESVSVWSSAAFVSHHLFFSSLHLCQRSWLHILYLVWADLVFLLSMLFLVRFLLLISSSSSMLFPFNQSLCFLTAVLSFSLNYLYMIDLKMFHSSTIPAGILTSLSFSRGCRLSLTLLILILLVVSFLIGILSFLILSLTHSGLDYNRIRTAVGPSHHFYVQKVCQIILSCDTVNKVPVFGFWMHPGVLVDLLVFDVGVSKAGVWCRWIAAHHHWY